VALVKSSTMVAVAASRQAEVQDGCNQQIQDVDSGHRHAAVEHPGVSECGQRQKDEAKNKKKQVVVIRPIQISREKKEQRQGDAREQQKQNQE